MELGNASEAYRQSYDASRMPPESIHVKANEVLNNVKVALRIKELKDRQLERQLKRHDITIDTQIDKLQRVYDAAFEDKEYAPCINAVMGQSKHLGLIVDKTNNENKNTHEGKIKLTAKEIKALDDTLESDC